MAEGQGRMDDGRMDTWTIYDLVQITRGKFWDRIPGLKARGIQGRGNSSPKEIKTKGSQPDESASRDLPATYIQKLWLINVLHNIPLKSCFCQIQKSQKNSAFVLFFSNS